MLEHPGPREPPFLIYVAHENDHCPRLLGKAHHARRGFPHLGHAPGGAVGIVRVQGLDGIENQKRGLFLRGVGEDGLHSRFRGNPKPLPGKLEPLRPQRQLGQGFLPGDVKHRRLLRQRAGHLEQHGRLTGARTARQQHHGAGHEAAPEHPVELL